MINGINYSLQPYYVYIPHLWADFRVNRWREADGGAMMASKPKTTVQDCVPTSVKVKPLDIFNVTLGKFPAVFLATESGVFSQNVIFSKPPPTDFVPKPNRTVSTVSQHEIEDVEEEN